MNTIDYGRNPGMHPAPMIEKTYEYAEAVTNEIVIETPEWKAYYRLLTIYSGDARVSATYYLVDVDVK